MRRPGAFAVALAAALAALPGAEPVEAQRRPPNIFAVDAEILGGSLSYARRRGETTYVGVAGGVGGSFSNRMLLAGRHFSHPDGPSYEERDGSTSNDLFELLHLAVFHRWAPSAGRSVDAGLRGAVFLHSNSFDDDPGFALFVGGYANALFGWRRVKLGPRVLVGVFTEGSGTTELGVLLIPLTARVEFGW